MRGEQTRAENRKRARLKRDHDLCSWCGPLEENTKLIPLGHNHFSKVDASDFEFLNRWNWAMNNYGYAVRKDEVTKESIQIHRLLMPPPEGKQIDHINRDKLDNRRRNIRFATVWENSGNVEKRGMGTSKFKGVSRSARDGRWIVFAKDLNGRSKNLGRYSDEITAAAVYNEYAKNKWGQFACVNSL